MKAITIVGFGDSITMDNCVEDKEKRWLSIPNKMLSKEYPSLIYS